VIKNGVLVDGSGMPRHRADVAVQHGRIVSMAASASARGPYTRRATM
jgi:N-acyl-D-aspartate/D-glutamate deacylase